CILQLAPPLPVNEGAVASALVRLGLLRAWCSSDAALTNRIRRRQLRGEALLHSLAHGRYPTQRELESWIVGNDAVQLGFPELLVATASGDTSTMLKTLVAHLDSLQQLLQLHIRTSKADAFRASTLRALLHDDSHPPIVAFSQFASTVRALHRALSDLAGIASLTSAGGMIASGAIARHELIANFAPKASGRPPPAAAQRIKLLLSTDLLAEGVNLQDAGVVVHLDLPWTHALKQQRVGRVARMGSGFEIVHVHTLAPPMGAEAALHVVATLERKAGLHHDWIGSEGGAPGNGASATTSASDEATLLRKVLRSWGASSHRVPAESTIVASVSAALSGWIAVVTMNGVQRVVASINVQLVNHVDTVGMGMHDAAVQDASVPAINSTGTDISLLLKAVRAVPSCHVQRSAATVEHAHLQTPVCAALREVDAWLHTQHLQSLAGDSPRTYSPAQRLALDTLSLRIRDTSAIRRASLSVQASRITEQILNSRGAEADKRLALWVVAAAAMPVTSWFQAFPEIGGDRTCNAPRTRSLGLRIAALLLLQPDFPADSDESLK
ncbi:MAG: helicase-related protein, partial [Gemmatimonadaceae bacterium]